MQEVVVFIHCQTRKDTKTGVTPVVPYNDTLVEKNNLHEVKLYTPLDLVFRYLLSSSIIMFVQHKRSFVLHFVIHSKTYNLI